MCSIIYVVTINSLFLNLCSSMQEIDIIARAGVSYLFYETSDRSLFVLNIWLNINCVIHSI